MVLKENNLFQLFPHVEHAYARYSERAQRVGGQDLKYGKKSVSRK